MGIYNARYLAYLVKLAATPAAVAGYTFEAPLYIRLVKVDGAALEATEYYKARARTFLDRFADVMVLVQPDCVLSPADQARLAGLMANPDLEVVMHGWYDVPRTALTVHTGLASLRTAPPCRKYQKCRSLPPKRSWRSTARRSCVCTRMRG